MAKPFTRHLTKGAVCALALICFLALSSLKADKVVQVNGDQEVARRLLSDDDDGPQCDHIGQQVDECQYVKDYCGDVAVLIDYLQFRYCTLGGSSGSIFLAYLILLIALAIIISLLASTADVHFVPALETLSDKLNLSKPVAGITLLAVGNGAPDVFTALAGLAANDFPLVLGALIGASMCISSVVLGAVLLVRPVTVNKQIFLRDVLVYITATIVIVCVASDGVIWLYESCLFLILYVFYVALVVGLERWNRYKAQKGTDGPIQANGPDYVPIPSEGETPEVPSKPTERTFSKGQASNGGEKRVSVTELDNVIMFAEGEHEGEKKPDNHLDGITWPAGDPFYVKIRYFLQLPFSILRWLSAPPADEVWGPTRRLFWIVSPAFIGFLLLLASEGWDGFAMDVGALPVPALIAIIGGGMTLVFHFTSWPSRSPPYYGFFTFLSFCTSIAWLNILANECVALLQTFGVMWDISTAVLGLTVLAIGNSVGDFVADTAVARAGYPETGVASCFGSPLLNDVVGLGLSLTITCAGQYPDPFKFDLNWQVIAGWIFLGSSLVSSLLVFVGFNYTPPRMFGWFLVVLYFVFLAATVALAVA